MANFAINPTRFIPAGLEIQDGGEDRLQRIYANLQGPVRRNHEEYTLAVTDFNLPPAQLAQLFDVRNYIEQEVHLTVQSFNQHPHGIGMYQLRTPLQREQLMSRNPHLIGDMVVRFIRHDHGINYRDCPYTRRGWVVLLGFLLDYLEGRHIETAVSGFAKVLQWVGNPRDKARVILEVLYDSVLTVPRSLVLRLGFEWGGEGRSWTVPVYVLNSEYLDVQPGDEDQPPPNNGNPHPFEDEDDFMNIQLPAPAHQPEQNQQPLQVWPEWEQAIQGQEQGGHAAPAAPVQDLEQQSGISSVSVNNRIIRGPAQPMEIQFGPPAQPVQVQSRIPDLNIQVQ